MDIKGKEILFRIKNKSTGEEGWLDASELIETIFKMYTDSVLMPLLKKVSEKKGKEKK